MQEIYKDYEADRQKIRQIEIGFDHTPKLCYCHMPLNTSKPVRTI